MRQLTFTQWFQLQFFSHFEPEEFTSYFNRKRDGARNSVPSSKLWPNILPTLQIVEELREHFDKPIVLLSSYRSPSYNRAVGGELASYHMKFQALDIAVAGVSPKEVFTVLKKWRTQKRFSGGLGLYETFVHIDTRGHDATW